jgi:tetratricopeptide repeat protein/peptidase C39-like protein
MPAAALRRIAGKARARAGFLFAALALLCLSGCISVPQTDALRENPPKGIPTRVELTHVPFHMQDDFLCGPATLAMVFNAAGVADASVATVEPLVYLPGRQGSLQSEMLGATRRTSLVAYPLAPQMEDLLREVAAGTPVIVLLNLALKIAPVWHYAVIVGYDLEKREVIARSAKRARDEWGFGFLEYFWQGSDYWSMVALPPGRVPATAREGDFAVAVAALEHAGHGRAARESYLALLERWPDNLIALIGLGNVEYGLKDLAASERAFRRATVAHPTSAVAFNNLAHVLAALGRLAEAETAARAAIALEGPTLAQAQKTLEAILKQQGKPAPPPS